MRFSSSRLSRSIEINESFVSSIVIENGAVFRGLVEDIVNEIEYGGEELILSKDGEAIPFAKSVELIKEFVPFTLNKKRLQGLLMKRVEKYALTGENFDTTQNLLAEIRRFLSSLLLEIPHSVATAGLSVSSLLKAADMTFEEEDASLIDLIIDYFRLIREFLGERIFILVNLRSYLTDDEMSSFLKVAVSEKFLLVLIDSSARQLLPDERRLIVDADFCEINQMENEIPPHSQLRKMV